MPLGAGAAGCGGDDDGDDDAVTSPDDCNNAGQVYTCRVNGRSGTQVCTSEGKLSACMPSSTSPPVGGSGSDASVDGGNAGQGGNAGSAGRGGRDSGTTDAGSTAPPGDEQCDNGEDDDGDGDTDCADDDCGERECLDEAPDGWTGPTVLRLGTSTVAECSGEYDNEVLRGGTGVAATNATCSACTCAPSAGGCAGFVNFVTSAQDDCGGTPTCAQSVSSACTTLTSPCLSGLTTGHVTVSVPGSAASCAPSAQSPTLPEPSWEIAAIGCSAQDLVRGGCDGDERCAPKRPAGTDLCIVRDGDRACPDGPYSQRRLYYSDVADSRACSACACASDCSYAWKLFGAADTTCSQGAIVSITGAGQCISATPSGDTLRVGLQVGGTGACAPSGGTPTGTVQASDPMTACCIP